MPKTLHKQQEAQITPCMWTCGSILIVIMSIVMFIMTMPITLA